MATSHRRLLSDRQQQRGAGLNVETLTPPGGKRPSQGIGVDPPDGKIPYLPWARRRRDEVLDNQLHPS
jgi:hypothetical protein